MRIFDSIEYVEAPDPTVWRFDAFMESALYGPNGFYATGRGRAGRRGDFITSPEVGPLFGRVLSDWVEEQWVRLGRPETLDVFDIGAGPGALMRSMARTPRDVAAHWRLHSIDLGDGLDPARLAGAIVIANELLDNLSIRIVGYQQDRWWELAVRAKDPAGADARLIAVPLAHDEVQRLPRSLRHAASSRWVPWHQQAIDWVTRIRRAGVAALIVFDYGAVRTETLSERGGWLRTYRGHERGHDPLRDPGQFDITTDIGFDQFEPPDRLMTQADFLRFYGIEERVAEGKQYWLAHAAAPDLDAMIMRSRISESEALLDAEGLGSWLVAQWVIPAA